MKRPTAALAIFLAAAAAPVSAQLGDIQVEIKWGFDSDAAHARSTVQTALKVRIEEKYHVNSNKPLEEFLIPTILTVTPPEGFTVREVVYPDPIMIRPSFSEVDMAVFEQEFVIGVALEVGGSGPAHRRHCRTPNPQSAIIHRLRRWSLIVPLRASPAPQVHCRVAPIKRSADGPGPSDGGRGGASPPGSNPSSDQMIPDHRRLPAHEGHPGSI